MNNNVGIFDRIIRLTFAGTLLYFGLGIYGNSTLGIAIAVVAIIPLMTALAGSCPMYIWLGISTDKANPQFLSK